MLTGIVRENQNFFAVKEDFVFSNINDKTRSVLSRLLEVLSSLQFAKLGRFLYVKDGSGTININMQPFDLRVGDVLVIPENTYFELKDMSNDFNAQAVSFKDLPVSFLRCTQLRLPEKDRLCIEKYLDLVWNTLQREEPSTKTIEYLLSALMNDLMLFQQEHEAHSGRQMSRSEQLLQQFFDLVTKHGATQRKVGFYADILCVSPNHLSSVVKRQSGQTVLQWLNAQTVLEAKALLKHSNLSVYEVAERLGFESATFFSRFFKRETGMSPRAYRTV